jgi:2-polyprenyl-3-methyl-5-hydroxy-6-metoxy-1,4-benzoquinol methylase
MQPAHTTTATESPAATVTPDRIMALGHAFWMSQILSSAAHYDFFTHISHGRRTAADVAAAAGTDPTGTRMVLDALVSAELLRKEDGLYSVTPEAQAFLVTGSPACISPMIAGHPQMLWEDWGHLREALKERRPRSQYVDASQSQRFFSHLIRVIMPLALGPADALATHLGAGASRKGMRILDVGAGSGAWTIPFARHDPSARITAFDLPAVVAETAKIVDEFGVASNYTMQGGDLNTADFGERAYDLVVLGNMCHGLTADRNRALLKRVHRALATGGQVAIADMVPNDERTGPPFALMFAVNMYLMTDGDTYPLSEYSTWLHEAGFTGVTTYDTHRSHSPIILATRSN